MECLSNQPMELLELAGLVPQECPSSKFELLLAIEKALIAACELPGRRHAKNNLALVRKLILTERVREWAAKERVKLLTGLRVLIRAGEGVIEGIAEGVGELDLSTSELLPRVRTRGGALRTKGAARAAPQGVLLKACGRELLQSDIFVKPNGITLSLQRGKEPLMGMRIWLSDERGEIVAEDMTDFRGVARFSRPVTGTWVVLIEAPRD